MKEYTTGNAKVDQMGQIRLTGNVTPQVWYRTITRENGKPHLLAIAILSDIVYWYRPAEVRDESDGNITGYRKRFKADMLQRSYDQFADFLGVTKRNVTDAIVLLESLGVIRREFRTVEIGGMKYNNVLFIDLFPEQLLRLTYPETPETEKENAECTPCPANQGEGVENSPGDPALSLKTGGGVTGECPPCPEKPGEGSRNPGTRNTENISEITTGITLSSSSSSSSSDDDRGQEMMIRKCHTAALEGGCTPELADAVVSELHRYGRAVSLSPPAFLNLCRNISDHAPGDIANMSAYIRKCIANMVLSQKLSEAKAAHQIRADNILLQEGYGVTDWAAFEQNILSN